MSNLWLPPSCRKQQAQMSKPIVFLYAKKVDWIILPADPNMELPGYQRIECRHAHEVEKWSAKLRAQEKRMRDLKDEERYEVEEPIRAYGESEMRKALANCTDEKNRLFMVRSLERIREKREQAKKEYIESYMACEAKDGVAP